MGQRKPEFGCYPPSLGFEHVLNMDYYMGSKQIHEVFPYQPDNDQPSVLVTLDHRPRDLAYNFSFFPVDWEALPGEHHKNYEAIIDRDVPMIQLSTFSTVLHEKFETEQAAWVKFQLEKGMFLPHESEVSEFLLIIKAFAQHIVDRDR